MDCLGNHTILAYFAQSIVAIWFDENALIGGLLKDVDACNRIAVCVITIYRIAQFQLHVLQPLIHKSYDNVRTYFFVSCELRLFNGETRNTTRKVKYFTFKYIHHAPSAYSVLLNYQVLPFGFL